SRASRSGRTSPAGTRARTRRTGGRSRDTSTPPNRAASRPSRTGPPRDPAESYGEGSALFDRNEGTLGRAEVNLARPRDLLLGVEQHLFPLRDPAGDARNREEHRERRRRDPDRLIDQARVEVDVRVELPLDEVVVLQGDPLELESDVELGVAPGDGEDLVG